MNRFEIYNVNFSLLLIMLYIRQFIYYLLHFEVTAVSELYDMD